MTSLAQKITIFDAVVYMKTAWDALSSDTITWCFCKCGITYDPVATPPSSPADTQDEPDVYDQRYNAIMEVSWDEYNAFDANMQLQNSCHNPGGPDQLDTPDDVIDDTEDLSRTTHHL